MRRSLALLVLLASCRREAPPPVAQTPPPPDPSVPREVPVGKLAGAQSPAPPATEARGLVGPDGALNVEVYRKRRRALMALIKNGAALIDAGWDAEKERPGSGFYYLTGVEERGASLYLAPQAPSYKETLFLRGRDVETERVEGERSPLPSRAQELSTGIGRIARESAVQAVLLRACATWNSLSFVSDYVPAPRPAPREMTLYREAMERSYECHVQNLQGAIGRMRLVKEPEELALMRRAIANTGAGHAAAIASVRAGAHEFEVKQQIEDAFRHAGSRRLGFPSIVGSGPNAAVLHYPEDDRAMRDGELVVVDIGAEFEHYAADVTRTLPVSGKYSPEQREIYETVLRAQAAGIAYARAGVSIEQVDLAVRKVVEDAGYYDQYLHSCCHTVGLDVHDTGDRTLPLPAGAVITVEPGIYLPQQGFGIRIEDEILITASGNEVITAAIPKDPDEIERLIAAARKP